MYFENRIASEVFSVKSAENVVKLLNHGYNASMINDSGDKIIFVDDGGLDQPFFEVAVINQTQSHQVDSITWDWVEEDAAKINLVNKVLNTDFQMYPNRSHSVPLTIDDMRHNKAWYSCSTCGEIFVSTYDEQCEYDLYFGIGYCQDHR